MSESLAFPSTTVRGAAVPAFPGWRCTEAGASVPVILDIKNVFTVAGKKQVEGLLCCSQPVKYPLWEVRCKLFLDLPKKGKTIPKGGFPIRR